MSGAGMQEATRVYIGGVAGFDDLALPTNTTLLRATGVVGLYMHADAMAAAYAAGQLPAISAAMSGTGPGEIELGINNVATGFFAGWWKLVCLDNGLHPDRANIDCDFAAAGFTDEWHAYVDAARAVGIATLAPIFSPNGPGASLDPFATSPGYVSIRQAALYGGALCIDAPPVFFAQRGQAYQTFTEQELAWATQQGLRTTVILSPYGDDATFLADTKTFVSRLAADHAVPTEWVVENYTLGDADGIGSDTDVSSMAGVALWVAQNAPVTVSASVATPATVVATPAGTPSSGAVTSEAAGVQYIVTPLGGSTAVCVKWSGHDDLQPGQRHDRRRQRLRHCLRIRGDNPGHRRGRAASLRGRSRECHSVRQCGAVRHLRRCRRRPLHHGNGWRQHPCGWRAREHAGRGRGRRRAIRGASFQRRRA